MWATDKHTDKQMDRPVTRSRSRCRERWLNKLNERWTGPLHEAALAVVSGGLISLMKLKSLVYRRYQL